MSSMIPTPPARINIGGGPGAAPGGPQQGGGKPGAPDSAAVAAKIKEAIDALREAEDLEGDAQDQALLSNAVASLRKFLGSQQANEDALMGGGPAVKVMRKNPGAPAGGA